MTDAERRPGVARTLHAATLSLIGRRGPMAGWKLRLSDWEASAREES